jgi:hypothetical protein
MIGPGKYDGALTAARGVSGATAALLIVLKGPLGAGFSVQADLVSMTAIPAALRMVADQIEADLRGGKL